MNLHLFDAFGIEMEYMLVDRDTLDVRPVADSVLAILNSGVTAGDYERGPITWSNELALHVLELKTTRPTEKLRSAPSQFETAIREIAPVLDRLNVRLLPTAMHPWMNPSRETVLWPHENFEIYQTYDRIFGCRSHGWANVQSVHLNLPFSGDDEFAKLHAAVRLVLPILPGLAASSPIIDGSYSGWLDTRMNYYAQHCAAAPTLTGELIPEPVYSEAAYRESVYEPIAAQMGPLDPDGNLELDFLNARGAIARFDRGSIELRVMDVQEYPGADVSICAAVIAVLKSLVDAQWSTHVRQRSFPSATLKRILDQTTQDAELAVIDDASYLSLFGIEQPSITTRELWTTLLESARRLDTTLASLFAPLEIILNHGTLATRIRRSLGDSFDCEELHNVYDQLADCLDNWEPFQP